MGSVTRHFEPGPNGTVRIRTRFEDDDGRVGHSQSDVTPRYVILGIPWAEFVAAGTGTIEQGEDGTATIRHVDDQPGDTEAGQ